MKTKNVELKDGRKILLRQAFPPDASGLNKLISTIINTSDYTLTTAVELDLSIESQEARIYQFQKDAGSVIFLAELDDQLLGTLDFKSNTRLRNRHWGELGMGVLPDFRGLGLGRLLLQELFEWGKQHPQIEKICLGVFAENEVALHLYRSMGFKEEGCWVKAIKLGPDQYADEIRMYKFV